MSSLSRQVRRRHLRKGRKQAVSGDCLSGSLDSDGNFHVSRSPFQVMSKLLEVLAAPLLKNVTADWPCQSVEAIYMLAALAWNMSLGGTREESAQLATMQEEIQRDVIAMMTRKKALYSQDPRRVLHVHVTRTASGFHAQALSARMG